MSNLQSLQILSSTFFLVYLPVSISRGNIPIRSWQRSERLYLGMLERIYSSVFISFLKSEYVIQKLGYMHGRILLWIIWTDT